MQSLLAGDRGHAAVSAAGLGSLADPSRLCQVITVRHTLSLQTFLGGRGPQCKSNIFCLS